MKVVTAAEIRELDRRAIEEFGVPGVVLMENAGRAVVEALAREFGALRGRGVAVFCGPGNNGGDGFVIARLLHLAGASVSALFFGDVERLRGDAKVYFDLLTRLSPETVRVCGVDDDVPLLSPTTELVVDALLGTGVQDAPREPVASAIRAINGARLPVLAVDVPSGVNSDTGATPGEAVRADLTLTFAYPKLGLFLPPATEHIGRLHVADIGFDWEAVPFETPTRLLSLPNPHPESRRQSELAPALSDLDSALSLLGPRRQESNKGDFGHVAVVAGSRGMAGAPALVARAAQRVGAGLVTVLTPESAQPMLAAKLDEQMTLPLPEEDGAASKAAFDAVKAFAERATVLCVGPGLTQKPGAVRLVLRLITELDTPLILDADGLNALAQEPQAALRRSQAAPLVITPHPGEAARLLGTDVAAIQSDRIGAVRDLAQKFRAVAVLKGRFTLIADPDGSLRINTTGNPGMATGGMGDTLTGIMGGIVAQALASLHPSSDMQQYGGWFSRMRDAASLAVALHGLAGDFAASETGEAALTAGDVIARLPAVLRSLSKPHPD